MSHPSFEWACGKCTFVQNALNDQCELCGNPHQKSATTKHQQNRPEPIASPQPAIEDQDTAANKIKNTKSRFINSQSKLLLPAYCKSIQRDIAQPIINIILLYYYINKTIDKRIKIDIAYYEFACIGYPLYNILNACKEEYNRQTKCISKYFDIEQQKYDVKFCPNSMTQNISFLKQSEAFIIIFQPAKMTPTKAHNSLKLVETYLNKCSINIPIVLIASKWELIESDASLQRDVKRQLDNFCNENKNKFIKWFPVSERNKLNMQKCIEFILSTIVIKRDMLNMEPFGDCVEEEEKNIMNDVFKEEGITKLVIVEEDAKIVQAEKREKLEELMKEKHYGNDDNDESDSNEQGYYKYVTELQNYGGFLVDETPDEDNLGYLQTANELHDYDDGVWDAFD